ncbi:hypothetical protein D3C76_865580 [compost metagenome]
MPCHTQLICGHNPWTYRRGAVHGLLGQQVQAPNLLAGIPRTDVIAHRIPQQTGTGIGLIQQRPAHDSDQFHLVIELGGQRRVIDLIISTNQRRLRFHVRQRVRRRITAQTLEVAQVIEAHTKNPTARFQRRKQARSRQGQPFASQVKGIRRELHSQPGPLGEWRIDPPQAIRLRIQ